MILIIPNREDLERTIHHCIDSGWTEKHISKLLIHKYSSKKIFREGLNRVLRFLSLRRLSSSAEH
jgi:hypothetical protein